MKRSKNTQKKIWVKRIWVNKDEFDYIFISTSQFLEVEKDQNLKLAQNKPVFMLLEKAPFWYSWYKLCKPYFKKGLIFLVAAIITALIALLVEHYLGSKK